MDILRKNGNKILIGTLLVLLACATAGDFILIKKTSELQADAQKRNGEIKELKDKLTGSTTETASLKKENEASAAQCKTDNDNLQAKINAFAKQAAACEKIKRKLHIK